MIARSIRAAVEQALQEQTAVLLCGLPRVGRTSLTRDLALDAGGVVLIRDAAEAADRNDIAQTGPFLGKVSGKLVIIDNIDQRAADALIRLVRSASAAPPQPRFLLLTRQSSLAYRLAQELVGFVRSVELTPIQPAEAFAYASPEPPAAEPLQDSVITPAPVGQWNQDVHWLRGGLPDSLQAADDEASFRWRTDYTKALLHGDFSEWGVEAGDRLDRIVDRITHGHGQIFNEDTCRSELGLDRASIRRTIDMLVKVGLVRRLPNFSGSNPLLYVRDSGLMHAMLGIRTLEQLRAHKICGHSWQCFAAEALITSVGDFASSSFYRDKSENEIDLVVDFRPLFDVIYAIEFKVNNDRNVKQGFWRACEIIRPQCKLVVHNGQSTQKHQYGLDTVPLLSAIEQLRSVLGKNIARQV